MAEENNQEAQQNQETEEHQEQSTQNDDAVKAAVEAAKAEWEKDLAEKLNEAKNEGARLAKLSVEERRKEEDAAESKEMTKTVIDTIKMAFDKAVEAGVTEKLKGKTPSLGAGHGGDSKKSAGSFIDIIRKNQRGGI